MKKIPNPVLALPHKGYFDLMDAEDVRIHLTEEEHAILHAASVNLCDNNIFCSNSRVRSQALEITISWELSCRELFAWDSSRKTLSTLSERVSTVQPAVCFPFFFRTEIPPMETIVVAAASAEMVRNDFAGLLKEDLRIGSSLHDRSLDLLASVNAKLPIAIEYAVDKARGTIPYCGRTDMKAFAVVPPIEFDELHQCYTTMFIDDQVVDRATLPWTDASTGRRFVYMPEEHGMVEEIKRVMPALVSGLRLYTSGSEERYVRVPEAAYLSAKKRLFQHNLTRKRELDIHKESFYLAYKLPDEEWRHPDEKLLMGIGDPDHKHTVTIRFRMHYLTRALTDADLFWSHPEQRAIYLPGCPVIDAVSLPEDDARGPPPKLIDANKVGQYLMQTQKERTASKAIWRDRMRVKLLNP